MREGVCVKLYDEYDLEMAPEFTDPEIRRSSLAGVVSKTSVMGEKSIAVETVETVAGADPEEPRGVLVEVGHPIVRQPLPGAEVFETLEPEVLGPARYQRDARQEKDEPRPDERTA